MFRKVEVWKVVDRVLQTPGRGPSPSVYIDVEPRVERVICGAVISEDTDGETLVHTRKENLIVETQFVFDAGVDKSEVEERLVVPA